MRSDQDAKEELLDLYKRAVKRHLISDVPLGLLLSGGIDSGLLLGLMNLNGSSWPTFTVGYGESFKDDELVDAERSAEIFSANHTSIHIDRKTFESSLPKIVSCLEEPIASSSIVPMYFVCQRASQDVKVVLVGQGPDELFGGYNRHLGVKYGAYWRMLPEWLRSPLTSMINALPRRESFKRGVYSLNIPERMKRYQHVFSILPGEKIDSLFHDGLLPTNAGDQILKRWSGLEALMKNTDELGGLNFLEIRSSLPDELMMYADKLSMAHSLEVRVPYLDREIVEYVERLSSTFKVRYGSRKWLHRQVCNNFMPKEIIKRPKRGFAVNVVDDWFNDSINGKMNDFFHDSKSLMYNFLRPQAAQKLYNEHVSGKHDNHKILFSLVVFEEWLRLNYRN
jgi:asparagine synthase (glutamine-hydrolysing)